MYKRARETAFRVTGKSGWYPGRIVRARRKGRLRVNSGEQSSPRYFPSDLFANTQSEIRWEKMGKNVSESIIVREYCLRDDLKYHLQNDFTNHLQKSRKCLTITMKELSRAILL